MASWDFSSARWGMRIGNACMSAIFIWLVEFLKRLGLWELDFDGSDRVFHLAMARLLLG